MTQPSASRVALVEQFGRRRLALLGIASILMPLVWLTVFGSTGRDDSFITFGIARQFAETGQLTNLNGDFVEGSTTLGYVLVLAVIGAVRPEAIPLIGWVISLVMLGVSGLVAALAVGRSNPRMAWLVAAAVWAFPPFAYWSASGAETTTAVAVLLVALLLVGTTPNQATGIRPLLRGLAASSVFLMRPDIGLTFAGVVALVTVTQMIGQTRRGNALPWGMLWACIGILTGIVMVSLIRLIIFGVVLPQSVLAKVGGGSSAGVSSGIAYVEPFLRAPYVFVWMVLALMLASWRLRQMSTLQWLFLLQAGAGLLVVILSRGDWMEWGRLLLAPLVCLIVATVSLVPSAVPWRVIAPLIVLVLGANAVALSAMSSGQGLGSTGSDPTSRWSAAESDPSTPWHGAASPYVKWNGVHLRDAIFLSEAVPAIQEILDRQRPDTVLTLASEQAGMNFYYLRETFGNRIEFIDLYQLTTKHFSGCEGLERNQAGRYVSPQYWAAQANDCAPPLPDLVIDVGYPKFEELPGYRVIAGVTGKVTRSTGAEIPTNQFLVVSDSLD